MKRTDGLIQCKCKEWRKPEEICNDGTCVYCEDVESEEKEPSVDELLDDEFNLLLDLENVADAYMVDDDDEFEHDW